MKPNPIQKHFDKILYFFIANSSTVDNEMKVDMFQFISHYNKMCKYSGIDNKRVISDEEVLRILDLKFE